MVRGFLARRRARKLRENAKTERLRMVNFLSAIEANNLSLYKKMHDKIEEDKHIEKGGSFVYVYTHAYANILLVIL